MEASAARFRYGPGKTFLFLALTALLFPLPLLHAAIYYVDATSGNDGWSGTLPNAQGSDGPWQTISKVNTATLLPGDQVLFQRPLSAISGH